MPVCTKPFPSVPSRAPTRRAHGLQKDTPGTGRGQALLNHSELPSHGPIAFALWGMGKMVVQPCRAPPVFREESRGSLGPPPLTT